MGLCEVKPMVGYESDLTSGDSIKAHLVVKSYHGMFIQCQRLGEDQWKGEQRFAS